jgi:hypothetical protein
MRRQTLHAALYLGALETLIRSGSSDGVTSDEWHSQIRPELEAGIPKTGGD